MPKLEQKEMFILFTFFKFKGLLFPEVHSNKLYFVAFT